MKLVQPGMHLGRLKPEYPVQLRKGYTHREKLSKLAVADSQFLSHGDQAQTPAKRS